MQQHTEPDVSGIGARLTSHRKPLEVAIGGLGPVRDPGGFVKGYDRSPWMYVCMRCALQHTMATFPFDCSLDTEGRG